MKTPLCLLSLLIPLSVAAQRGPLAGFSTSDPYLIYYGSWDATQLNAARNNYRLVILHPVSNITASDISTIRSGPDFTPGTADDVIVLAYISVGEDDRTAAPVAGDGSGPRVDPRSSDSESLEGLNPLGDPSPGGSGFASYYLDDNDGNGQPDTNATFGGAFINPGDPAWYQIIRNNIKSVDGSAGLEEIMTSSTGAGYGCDGVFLDTLDTPAPNSFGATRHEWTAPAYQTLVKNISDDYPDKVILGNRGLFFYNPNLKTYAYTLRPYLNMVLFESYYTDSSGSGLPSVYFTDNKHNLAPKLNAEAARSDGFTVLSLGYTSSGEPASLGEDDFDESQGEQGWPLYRTNPFLDSSFNTDASAWNSANPDTHPPVWDSTAALGSDSDPGTAGDQPPAPKIGIQDLEALDGAVTVLWDVARDQTGPIRYNVYYTDQPTLDFGTAIKLSGVDPAVPVGYSNGFIEATDHASEFTISGLSNGTTYRFAVRAEDGLGQEEGNTVTLQATPAAVPSEYLEISIDGNLTDWSGVNAAHSDPAEAIDPDFADISIANDDAYLYVRFTLHASDAAFVDFNSHLFIDTDDNPGTGFTPGGSGFGSEFMIEGSTGYDQRAGGFNNGLANNVEWSIANNGTLTDYELRISLSAVYSSDLAPVFDGDTIRILLQDNAGDLTLSGGIRYRLATPPPPPSIYADITVDGDPADWALIPDILSDASGDGTPDIVSIKAANDSDHLYLLVEYAAPTDTNNFNGSPSTFLSLDNDHDTATGFDIYSLGEIGSEVSWQNDFAFSQATGVFNTSSVFTGATAGISPYYSHTSLQEYRIPRNATYDSGGGATPVFPQDLIRLAFWTDGAPTEFAGAFSYQFATEDPYSAWKSANFSPIQLADPLISGDDADPDGDGLVNLVEFGLGGTPLIFDSSPVVGTMGIATEQHLTLSYTRRTDGSVTVTPESSSDLETWNDDPAEFETVSTLPAGTGSESVVIRTSQPIPTAPGFVRLRVTLSP